MGNVAYKNGNRLYWDAEKGNFTDAGANELLLAHYHNGWELPVVQ